MRRARSDEFDWNFIDRGKSLEEILILLRTLAVPFAFACAFTAAVPSGAAAQTLDFTKLYDFSATGNPAVVSQPVGAPVLGPFGKFYGVSYYGGPNTCGTVGQPCGTFFDLTPPASPGDPWTETTIYEFQTHEDGLAENANPIYYNGVFYGTTYGGGCPSPGYCNGTIYSIAIHAGKTATKTTLYGFQGGIDGSRPTFLTVLNDNIYGITNFGGSTNAGVVFELSGSPLTETVIHTFDGAAEGSYPQYIVPYNGDLYVSLAYSGLYEGGTLVKLTPPVSPSTTWTSTVIFSFGGPESTAWNPEGFSFGLNGNIYGSLELGGGGPCTSIYGRYPGCGAIFELQPSGSGWTYTQIYGFQDGTDSGSPYAPPVFDGSGNIYVSSTGTKISPKSYGAILELSPAGSGYTPTVLHTFADGGGADPAGMLTSESGNLYGFATYGGTGNNGTFFSLSPAP
jgi:hypothetical protein